MHEMFVGLNILLLRGTPDAEFKDDSSKNLEFYSLNSLASGARGQRAPPKGERLPLPPFFFRKKKEGGDAKHLKGDRGGG